MLSRRIGDGIHKRVGCLVASAALLTVGCGGSSGFHYPKYSAEAGQMADTIIANCGDVDADSCRQSQMELAAGSLSAKDYQDVCHALVEKTGQDPANCDEDP
jgi:hypothetical protein